MEIQGTAIQLMEAVDKVRERRQMSDRKFSMHVLGISPAYYCRLKAGARTPTLNILRLLMQKLPELAPEVTSFVMRQGNNGNTPDIVVPNKGVKPTTHTNMYANPDNPPKNALKPHRGANHE